MQSTLERAGMKLSVVHSTEYLYPEVAHSSFNEVWMYPVTDERQTLVSFSFDVVPHVPIETRRDFFGNRVYFVHVKEGHTALWLMARSVVLTSAMDPPRPVLVGALEEWRNEWFEFLVSTKRVPLDTDWAQTLGVRSPSPSDDLPLYVLDTTQHINHRFTYTPNATAVDTPLDDFVRAGSGVCQDYTQALLAVLRSVGIPCRYTSGYIPTGNGPGGSHAWVEVFIPGSGWVGYDATTGLFAGEQYVKVAHGKDYDDCPPLKGLRWGGGHETLRVSVQVTPTP